MATYPAIDGVPVARFGVDPDRHPARRAEASTASSSAKAAGCRPLVYEGIARDAKEAGAARPRAGARRRASPTSRATCTTSSQNVREGKVPDGARSTAPSAASSRRIAGWACSRSPYVDPEPAARTVHRPAHQDLALRAAREGIVLLKNEGNLLPLRRRLQSIAVIGPNARRRPQPARRLHLEDGPAGHRHGSGRDPRQGARRPRSPMCRGCDVIGAAVNEIAQGRAAAAECRRGHRRRGRERVAGPRGRQLGTNGEGYDAATLELTGMQEDLVKAVLRDRHADRRRPDQRPAAGHPLDCRERPRASSRPGCPASGAGRRSPTSSSATQPERPAADHRAAPRGPAARLLQLQAVESLLAEGRLGQPLRRPEPDAALPVRLRPELHDVRVLATCASTRKTIRPDGTHNLYGWTCATPGASRGRRRCSCTFATSSRRLRRRCCSSEASQLALGAGRNATVRFTLAPGPGAPDRRSAGRRAGNLRGDGRPFVEGHPAQRKLRRLPGAQPIEEQEIPQGCTPNTNTPAGASSSPPGSPVAASRRPPEPGGSRGPARPKRRSSTRVRTAMLAMQRRAWEQGVAAQALLELGEATSSSCCARTRLVDQRQTAGWAERRLGDLSPTRPRTASRCSTPASRPATPRSSAAADADARLPARASAPRTRTGVIYHNHTRTRVWVDSFYMAPPFLAVAGHPREAVDQIEGSAATCGTRERSSTTTSGTRTAGFARELFWGVGNGWAAAGMARVVARPAGERCRPSGDARRLRARAVDGCLALPARRTASSTTSSTTPRRSSRRTSPRCSPTRSTAASPPAGSSGATSTPADSMRAAAHAKVDAYGLVQGVCGAPNFDRSGTAPRARRSSC